MPPCSCSYNSCNGKTIPRTTRDYHIKQDLKQNLRGTRKPPVRFTVPSSARPSLQPTNVQASFFPSPSSLSDSHSQPPFSVDLATSAAAQSPSTPGSLGGPAAEAESLLAARSAAEERGRVYIDDALTGPDAPSVYDDIGGDVDGDSSDSEGESDHSDMPSGHTPTLGNLPLPETPTASPVSPEEPPNENNPDPFYIAPTPAPTPSYRSAAETPIFLLYLLVSWLHTHFHVPFMACNTILVVVLNIFRTAGLVSSTTPSPYVTLPSVISHLGVEPVFQVLPVCENCLEVFPSSTKPGVLCNRCSHPLFKSTLRHNRRISIETESHQPHLQFPTKSIESQLRDIIVIPGMIEILEAWRYKPRTAGRYTDNFDGAVCHELPGLDKRPFFENPRPHGTAPELRIGLTLGVDW